MGSITCDAALSTRCVGLTTTRVGEPDAGNLHVRFDEGERLIPAPYSTLNPVVSVLSVRQARTDPPDTDATRG
jgi:hypothetical protein